MKLYEITNKPSFSDEDNKTAAKEYVDHLVESYGGNFIAHLKECRHSIEALKAPMLRGDDTSEEFVFRFSRKTKRHSLTASNFLLNFLDSVVLKKSDPRRGYSAFASMREHHTRIFGWTFYVFPVDSVSSFMASRLDINDGGAVLQLKLDNIISFVESYPNIEYAYYQAKIQRALQSEEINELDAKDRDLLKSFNTIYIKIVKLAEALKAIDPNKISDLKDFERFIDACKAGASSLKSDAETISSLKKHDVFSAMANQLPVGLGDLKITLSNFSSSLRYAYGFIVSLNRVIESLPKIEEVISGDHGLTRYQSVGDIPTSMQEVWFEGNYIMIKAEKGFEYADLREQLLKLIN
jgi:hypothetical protein